MNDLQTREFQVAAGRETDEPRTVRGLAVPYGEEIELFDGYFETIAPGALAPRDESDTSLKLVYRHDEPIGLITDVLETEAGIEVAARFSDTQTARDAYELVRDGVIDRLSIGFMPLETEAREDDKGTHTTIKTLALREVSLVPWPAYHSAAITEVRNEPTKTERKIMTDTPAYALASDLADLRADLTAIEQRAALADMTPAETRVDTRSPGAALKAILTDESYREEISPPDARLQRRDDGRRRDDCLPRMGEGPDSHCRQAQHPGRAVLDRPPALRGHGARFHRARDEHACRERAGHRRQRSRVR